MANANICLSLLLVVVAAYVATKGEAGVIAFIKWNDIENHLVANKDHDGHSLVHWYHLEFKDKKFFGVKKNRLQERLRIVVKFLSASKPIDCDDDHLATIKEVESGAQVAKNLKQVFEAKLNHYARLCQLNYGPKFRDIVSKLDSSGLEQINRLAENIETRFGEGVNYAASRLLDDNIKSLYRQDDMKFNGIDERSLKTACDSYVNAIGELYEPIKMLRSFSNKDFTIAPLDITEFEEARKGYFKLVLCQDYLSPETE